MPFANIAGATSTNPQYPTNGKGAVSTTAGNSNAATSHVELTGIMLTGAADGNVVIADHAGTSGYAITIPVVTTTVVPVMLPIPAKDAFFAPGIRFTASASGIVFTAFYRQLG